MQESGDSCNEEGGAEDDENNLPLSACSPAEEKQPLQPCMYRQTLLAGDVFSEEGHGVLGVPSKCVPQRNASATTKPGSLDAIVSRIDHDAGAE